MPGEGGEDILELATLMLAGGAKGFFENPEYLIGIPLAARGVIGGLIAFAVVWWSSSGRKKGRGGASDPEGGLGEGSSGSRGG